MALIPDKEGIKNLKDDLIYLGILADSVIIINFGNDFCQRLVCI